MTRVEFDKSFSCSNLDEIIRKAKSINQVKKLLKTFVCEQNKDLQDFLHNKAITFTKNERSKTYLYIDSDKKVIGYFTITITSLDTKNLDEDTIRCLDGHNDCATSIPCYLIGQLGKSDNYKSYKIGNYILNDALSIIEFSQKQLGGRFILVDAINNDKVIDFYKDNLFVPIENQNKLENIRMIKPFCEF